MTPRVTSRLSLTSRIGYAVGIAGVVGVFGAGALALWLHVARPGVDHDVFYIPTLLFAGLGWWGFHWADPRRAKDGGDWMLSAGDRLGRRATDPIVLAPASAVVIEDRHPVTPDTPVQLPTSVATPPTEASD